MDVTLITEGTYPHAYGGVSVWCDQLVQGLPEHDFRVLAITAGGNEQLSWELPGHVTAEPIALWAPAGGGDRRPPRGRAARRFERLMRVFLELILMPSAASQDVFPAVLRELFEFAQDEGGVRTALAGDQPVGWLLEAWNRRHGELSRIGVRPSVHDAVAALQLLEHSLRPLLRPPPPRGDVVHAVSNGLAALPALAAKWAHETPFCLTEHGIYLRERYLGYGRGYSWPVKRLMLGFLRLLCATAYRAADLITPGNQYNRRWEEYLGAAPERIQTVYNGVDPDHFPPAGAEPGVLTISWAGRVDPIKDLETLIRAYALVRAELPQVRLRLFGGTPKGGEAYRDRCVALAAELAVAEGVTFEGRVDDIRDAYVAGSLVVLSSVSEGFPYTLIEAMACGRATVATDVGGVREAVGDTGLVVPPRDPAAMAEACLRLLRDEMSRHRLGHAARGRALEYFTVDHAVGSFRTIYADLAGRPALSTASVA